jgi:PAS domain S-box-containing protein
MTEDNEDSLLRSVALQNVESIRIARQRAEQQAEATLWEQANLLNLTHDAIFVRDMKSVIRYWNRGAEELYGWTAEQAVGRVVYDLLKTAFPAPLVQIEGELIRAGRWEGELVHTKKDGSQIVVASRWSLQRDESGAPVAILTTNNDITERKRAEQARQEIEEQWRAAFESNPTMYFIVDAAGTIVSVNAFGAEQLGYTVSELVGQPVLNVFCEPDREAVRKHAESCFAQPGRMMRWEARKIRKDGTMIWVRETANAVVLKKRPVLLVVCEEITEQKRAEEAARRSEKELCDLIETVPAILWATRPDGSNNFVSRGWSQYTGLPAEDTAGWGWQAAIHPEDLERHLDKWRVSLISGEPFENEARFRRGADGEYRWFLIRGVPLRNEQGNVVKWYGTLMDIEDRKRAEQALQRSEAYLAEAQALTHTGSFGWDVATRKALHLSEEWYRIYGFDPYMGAPDWQERLQRIHPEDRSKWQDAVHRAINEKSGYAVEYRILPPTGIMKHLQVVGHPVLNNSGDVVQFMGSVTDITERKRAEEERERLRQLQADLARINRVTTMGELTASLAHEVNQPIAAAITNANTCLRWLARDQPNLEEAREAAMRIVKDGTRAAEIIKGLRSFYKKDAPYRRELVDVNEMAREMLVLLRNEAGRYSISMQTDLDTDLPKVMADRVQLQQVLMNLLLNGIEAMKDISPAGTLVITTQRAEDGQLLISVSDTGVGLPLEDADQIFNAFFTTKSHGTGMGLAISRSIIESHDGRLWAAANSGQGATFRFTLPCQS